MNDCVKNNNKVTPEMKECCTINNIPDELCDCKCHSEDQIKCGHENYELCSKRAGTFDECCKHLQNSNSFLNSKCCEKIKGSSDSGEAVLYKMYCNKEPNCVECTPGYEAALGQEYFNKDGMLTLRQRMKKSKRKNHHSHAHSNYNKYYAKVNKNHH